ncbi:MAG TPA: SHOCT domain-containing protein [Acidimicrobiia bacterium]|nr:SHOCT domain-containing protein [Acidimicrobiia bacterium]
MSSRVEDLRDLARLLDEGKVSQSEYEAVKSEILAASPDEWASPSPTDARHAAPSNGSPSNGAHEKVEVDQPEVDGEPVDPESKPGAPWVVFVKEIPPIYWAAMAAIVATFLFGGASTPIAWVTAGVSGVALVTRKTKNGRWMAWAGVVVGLLFSVSNVVFADQPRTVDASPPSTAVPAPETLPEIPVGSLGIRFEELSERWNALEEPPYLLKGISTTPEAGPLDSFTYRFDGGAVLAGAYNPSDQYIYALMAKASLQHELATGMYVHLCHLLYPGTHECFDAYVEESGVFGKTADELADGEHNALWLFEGNEWRLDIADGVQTMRVLGPQDVD